MDAAEFKHPVLGLIFVKYLRYFVLFKKMDVLRAMLHSSSYGGSLSGGHKTLAGAANHVMGLKTGPTRDGKKRFADTALAMSKALTLFCALDEAKEVREEVVFFTA
jgi:type I restriction enzyme, R subunit